MTYAFLSRTKYKLLVKLQQAEAVLRLSTLDIHPLQELLDQFDNSGQFFLVRVPLRSIFQNDSKEEGITSETRSWLGQVTVKLKLSGLRESLRFLFRYK